MNQKNNKVQGPVIPLPVPFKTDSRVDLNAMASYVDFLCRNGIQNLMTTVGTSRYNLLSWEEIKEVNRAVVEAAGGRAVTMVANPTTGDVNTAIDFAKHAEGIGADYLLLYFPDRHYGDDNTFNFFDQVAQSANIEILVHEMPMRNGLGPGQVQYSIELLHRLVELPNIAGLKEEALDAEYSNKVVKALAEKAIIIGAGGGMSRYLNRDYDLGAKAFLGGIGNFQPRVELEFFEAITNDGRNKASKIVHDIEQPFFEAVVPIGWHPSLKAALALSNLMSATERAPMKVISGKERDIIRKAMQKNDWL